MWDVVFPQGSLLSHSLFFAETVIQLVLCRFAGHSWVLIAVTFFTGLLHQYIAVQRRAILFEGMLTTRNDLMIREKFQSFKVFSKISPTLRIMGSSKLVTNGDPLNLPIFGSRDPLLFGGKRADLLGQRWTYRNLPHAGHGVLRTFAKVMDWKRENQESTIGNSRIVEPEKITPLRRNIIFQTPNLHFLGSILVFGVNFVS